MQEKLKRNLEEYKRFYGSYNEQMPILKQEKRTPLTISEVAQQRLTSITTNSDELTHSWWNKSINTIDGIFYHPNGNIKIVTNSPHLNNITPKHTLSNGQIILHEDVDESIKIYKSLNGEEFTPKDIQKYTNHYGTKKEVQKNPLWTAVIPDKNLRQNYIQTTFTLGEQLFGYLNMMGIAIGKPQSVCTGNPLFLDTINYDSDLIGNSKININHRGILIGKKQNDTNLNKYELKNKEQKSHLLKFTNPTEEYAHISKKYK